MGRKRARDEIEARGGRVTSAISGSTDYLVVGESAGPAKLERVTGMIEQGHHIELVEEDELVAALDRNAAEVTAEAMAEVTDGTPIPGLTFAALDFETANAHRSSACSVGVAVVDDGRIVRTEHQLLKPHPPHFDTMNVRVHGIEAPDVATAPSFREVWPDLAEVIGDRPIVAHNASFDQEVFAGCMEDVEVQPDLTWHCSVEVARGAWPDLPNHKLSTVSRHLRIEHGKHDALADAICCARTVIAAARLAGTSDINELGGATPAEKPEFRDAEVVTSRASQADKYDAQRAERGNCADASRSGSRSAKQVLNFLAWIVAFVLIFSFCSSLF